MGEMARFMMWVGVVCVLAYANEKCDKNVCAQT